MNHLALCAKTKENSYWKGLYLPINGKSHKDEELGVDWEHYHIDWRYVSPKWRDQIVKESIHNNSTDYYYMVVRTEDIERIEYARVEGKWNLIPTEYFATWITVLENKFAGEKCKGNRCPHKGASLLDCVPNKSGEITCPYHGLVIDQQTKTVKRVFTKEVI